MENQVRRDIRDMAMEAQFQTQLLTQQGIKIKFFMLNFVQTTVFNTCIGHELRNVDNNLLNICFSIRIFHLI